MLNNNPFKQLLVRFRTLSQQKYNRGIFYEASSDLLFFKNNINSIFCLALLASRVAATIYWRQQQTMYIFRKSRNSNNISHIFHDIIRFFATLKLNIITNLSENLNLISKLAVSNAIDAKVGNFSTMNGYRPETEISIGSLCLICCE